jgi:hypothetical protein
MRGVAALRLAPLLDMGNRGENRYNEAGSTGMGIFGGKGIRVAADRDYKEGDEVGKQAWSEERGGQGG